ncbi:MAG: tautomerase family protein [Bacillota bacterium]|nr:tautomerase family protein [Bacillota bacterium]
MEQKRALVQEVTKAVVSTVNCPEDAVMVLIHDLKSEDIGKAGKLPFIK